MPKKLENHQKQHEITLENYKPEKTSVVPWLKKQISISISDALKSRAIFQSNRFKKSQTSALLELAQILSGHN